MRFSSGETWLGSWGSLPSGGSTFLTSFFTGLVTWRTSRLVWGTPGRCGGGGSAGVWTPGTDGWLLGRLGDPGLEGLGLLLAGEDGRDP